MFKFVALTLIFIIANRFRQVWGIVILFQVQHSEICVPKKKKKKKKRQ